jgi:small membrane protein
MIAQLLLSVLLFAVLIYAWSEYRRAPLVGLASMVAAAGGLYFVWFPDHATALAELAGIGRGVDLIIYTWVAISLLMLLNLHLKLRAQMELITALAREMALADPRLPLEQGANLKPLF